MNYRLLFGGVTFKGLVKEFIKYSWMIVLSGLTVWMVTTGMAELKYQPIYESKATLVIRSTDSYASLSTLDLSQKMTSVYSKVFESSALLKKVEEKNGSKIEGRIICSQISETNIMTIVARAYSPREAYLLIKLALENYRDISDYVIHNSALDVLQQPSVPEYPINQSRWLRYRLYFILIGILIMVGIITAHYCTRPTIKTYAAAHDQLEGEIIGLIPIQKRRKKKNKYKCLIGSAGVSMAFSESIRRGTFNLQRHMDKEAFKVLLISSVNPHEGKTVISTNIAIALAEKEKRVILIDGDVMKPSIKKLVSFNSGDGQLAEVLSGQKQVSEVLQYDNRYHFWKLLQDKPAADEMSKADNSLIRKIIEECKEIADYVIIDSSPVMVSADAELWMEEADTALVIVREDVSDIRMINDAVDSIWSLTKDFSGFILNAFDEEASGGLSQWAYKY